MDMQGFHYNLDSLFPGEPDFLEEEEMCKRDCEYMKRLYPRQVRLAASIVEEYLDRYEYEGSPMYVEYPDAVTIYRMAKDVLAMMAKDVDQEKEEQWKNLLQVMVCQEIYVRRRRHDKFCRKFQHSRIR